MNNKYFCLCKVVELKSFTRAAEVTGYTQSAISQMIKCLEDEFGTALIDRRKDGISLTKDGEKFFPHIRSVVAAESYLELKKKEMASLENATIAIASYTSTGCNILPECIKRFKDKYPSVKFVIKQGNYTDTRRWLTEGIVDLGFIRESAADGLETRFLYDDLMMAVLPKEHPLAKQTEVSLNQLAHENFILLDESAYPKILNSLKSVYADVNVDYTVYDDYSIIAMVEKGIGVSILYNTVVKSTDKNVVVLPIKEKTKRTMMLAWKNWQTLPLAAQKFAQFLIEYVDNEFVL